MLYNTKYMSIDKFVKQKLKQRREINAEINVKRNGEGVIFVTKTVFFHIQQSHYDTYNRKGSSNLPFLLPYFCRRAETRSSSFQFHSTFFRFRSRFRSRAHKSDYSAKRQKRLSINSRGETSTGATKLSAGTMLVSALENRGNQ